MVTRLRTPVLHVGPMSGDPGGSDEEMGLTGAELLVRWTREELLDRWMRRYGRDVFNVCLAIVGEPALAKDVLQNVFIAIGKDLAAFGGRSPLRPLLLKIATHDARDAQRSA